MAGQAQAFQVGEGPHQVLVDFHQDDGVVVGDGFAQIVDAVDCGEDGEALALAYQRDAGAGGGGGHRRHARHYFDGQAGYVFRPQVLH